MYDKLHLTVGSANQQCFHNLIAAAQGAVRTCIPEYSLSYMLGWAGLYLPIRKVLQATEPLLTVADTAHEKSPTRVSCTVAQALKVCLNVLAKILDQGQHTLSSMSLVRKAAAPTLASCKTSPKCIRPSFLTVEQLTGCRAMAMRC